MFEFLFNSSIVNRPCEILFRHFQRTQMEFKSNSFLAAMTSETKNGTSLCEFSSIIILFDFITSYCVGLYFCN